MESTAPGDATEGVPSGSSRPNVLVVIADDLGYGDLGCHGNTVVETPTIDRLYEESVRLTRFYGGPMCSPSRASLMTGRYHYRTGVVDTYVGRSLMHPDEVTLPERLTEAGYRTGIFGKWHLGDNYPLRAGDRGFDESLVHRGGGIGQPGDVPDNDYFDPVLRRNGERERTTGYCTDVFAENAVEFIESTDDDRPFFAYVATNAPHVPLAVPDESADSYRDRGVDERTARLYGMVSNLDENLEKLLAALDRAGVANETVVVFTSDHGMAGDDRFNAGFRGSKGSVYEGGIRVPCFVRWPAELDAGRDESTLGHFVDVLPTVAAAAGVDPAPDRTLDGQNLLPALREGKTPGDRTLFVQMHRGNAPELHRNAAVVTPRYKLVNGRELYDIETDSGEQRNVAAHEQLRVRELRTVYEKWFADVRDPDRFDPPRIVLGTVHENPALLTRHDWRGPERSGWSDEDVGYWKVTVERKRDYRIELQFPEQDGFAELHVRFGDVHRTRTAAPGTTTITFPSVPLVAGEGTLEAWAVTETPGEYEPRREKRGVEYVTVWFEA